MHKLLIAWPEWAPTVPGRKEGDRGILWLPNSEFLEVIRRKDGLKIPPGRYVCKMATMATARLPGIWFGPNVLNGGAFIHAANTPAQLDGCIAPGCRATTKGVGASKAAMELVFKSLGGFVEGREVIVEIK